MTSAVVKESGVIPGTERELVTFRCGDAVYGLPIEKVREITLSSRITPAPHAKPSVRGAINLRGDVITVVDLAVLLDQPTSGESDRLLIVDYRGEKIALSVAEVLDVLSVSEKTLQLPPSNFLMNRNIPLASLVQLDSHIVYVVDIDGILAA